MDPFKKSPEFLQNFREGDAGALERVYRAFMRPLRHFILRGFAFQSAGRELYFQGLSDEHDLEDIIQETFRRAFGVKARHAYDGVRPYKNYLFTIARNAVMTDLTSRRRHIPVGEALMHDSPSEDLSPLEAWVRAHASILRDDTAPSSEEQIENLEIYGLVMGFTEALTKEEADFFRLRFLSQCSQEGTARRMGWNRARVRKLEDRLRRAFLCHAQGSGYLEARSETRRVRRPKDPISAKTAFARSRAIWRALRATQSNEFLGEAA